jgi:hypothetical protein
MRNKISIALVIALLLCTMPDVLPQETTIVSNTAAREQEAYSAFLEALSVLPEYRIPPEYRDQVPAVAAPRCATMELQTTRQLLPYLPQAQKQAFETLFARPTLAFSMTSTSGRFRIHYDTSGSNAVPAGDADQNGIPDFVDGVAEAYDMSYQLEIADLGYQAPPDDAGEDGPEFDIYISDLGGGFYGWTNAEVKISGTNAWTSFIEMDNDFDNRHFTPGLDGARVTAAHEFFHMIHFGYRSFNTSDEPFYYELCATWMEEIVYDDINDYYQYLPMFYRNRNVPFDAFETSNYGESVWNIFLMKNLQGEPGAANLIRRTWEIMAENTAAMDAIDQALRELNTDYNQQFAEFAVWNYFTGDLADPNRFYEEGAAYPRVPVGLDLDLDTRVAFSDSSKPLTHKYYRFTLLAEGNYAIDIDAEQGGDWRFASIVRIPGSGEQYQTFGPGAGQGLGFLPTGSELVIVAANHGRSNLAVSARPYVGFQFEIKQVRQIDAYPNPFIRSQQAMMTFRFGEYEADLEVMIVTSEGRIIRKARLSDGAANLTKNSFVWDGTDDDGDPVASGVYLFLVKRGAEVETGKFALIR